MNTHDKRKLTNALLLVLAATGIAQACSKDSGTEPEVPVITGGNGNNTGGSGNRGGTSNRGGNSGTDNPGGETSGGTSGASGSSGSSGSSGQGGSAGRGGSGGTGNDGGTGNEGGEGPEGCVRNPTAPEDFLIRCTDSRCAPFDNATRIPGFNGTLPEL